MSAKTTYRCVLAAAALVLAMPMVASANGVTPALTIANNEPTGISLSSQTAGVCGNWIGAGVVEPPPNVPGSSTSGPFKLSVSGTCAVLNHASMTYIHTGSIVTSCTYTITGNGSFTYGASGATGCSFAIDVGTGAVTFIFPDLTAGKRPTRR
jgi:hypothetical protein